MARGAAARRALAALVVIAAGLLSCRAAAPAAAIAAAAGARGSAAAGRPPCPEYCAPAYAPRLTGLQRLGGVRVRIFVLVHGRVHLKLMVARASGGRLVAARPALIQARPREVLAGSIPVGARLARIAGIPVHPLRPGLRSVAVDLRAGGRPLAPGLYVLRVDAVTAAGRVRARGSALVLARRRDGAITALLAAQRLPPPRAGAQQAGSVDDAGATLSAALRPGGLAATYYFQYGSDAGYRRRTAPRQLAPGAGRVIVSAPVSGLNAATTYHYRLVATQCGGCSWSTSYGPRATFTTTFPQQTDARRAVATYDAMQRYFYAASVRPGDASSLYLPSYPDPSRTPRYSPLWPFSRALAGTIALSGIPASLLGSADYQSAVADRLVGLSRYWDSTAGGPGYDSEPLPPFGPGAAKYYDDQAWVGLALASDYALSGDPSALAGAESVLAFVYPGGWAGTWGFEPGGIFWTQQGSGLGLSNHDRTTTSTVPNAELALALAGLDPAGAPAYRAVGEAIYGWAQHYLYNVAGNPGYDASQPALMFDKIRGDDALDTKLRTYNQGAMIAAAVRMYQDTGQLAYLDQAQAIAATALRTFDQTFYLAGQPAAFDVIFFRALLVLYTVCDQPALRSSIIETIQTYAQDAWEDYRSPDGLFRFPAARRPGYQLLTQGAMLELYAALAWSPARYGMLPS